MYFSSLFSRRRALGHAHSWSSRTARAIHFAKRSPSFSMHFRSRAGNSAHKPLALYSELIAFTHRDARAAHCARVSSQGSHAKIAAQQLVLGQVNGHKVCGRGFRQLDAQAPAVATSCLGCGPQTRGKRGRLAYTIQSAKDLLHVPWNHWLEFHRWTADLPGKRCQVLQCAPPGFCPVVGAQNDSGACLGLCASTQTTATTTVSAHSPAAAPASSPARHGQMVVRMKFAGRAERVEAQLVVIL